jgi:hypothetical protein
MTSAMIKKRNELIKKWQYGRRGIVMFTNARDKEVLNMQFTLMPILAKAWNKSYSELSDIFMKYDVPGYIDVCYEKYNSTGNQGIIDDLKEYIEMQGGSIE